MSTLHENSGRKRGRTSHFVITRDHCKLRHAKTMKTDPQIFVVFIKNAWLILISSVKPSFDMTLNYDITLVYNSIIGFMPKEGFAKYVGLLITILALNNL